MSLKNILLLHEDRLLASLFRDALENVGFLAEVARDADEATKTVRKRCPDAIVTDSVVPGLPLGKLIAELRQSANKPDLPIIVLPNARAIFAEAAQEAGATPLARGATPVGDMVNALQGALNLEKTDVLTKGFGPRAAEAWLKMSLEAAPETLMELRRALHEVSREGGSTKAVTDFYRRVHGFAEQMAILGERPLHFLTAQIENLAFDLVNLPEHVNPSVLRTLGQALDFLSTLLPDAVRNRLRDLSSAQVLVVDDEEGARKIIMAAMRMANLKSMAADTPTAGLAALGVQNFDLIFLDVGLPEMTGFELCTKIRALPLHERTPVVFISGMATFQNRVQSSLSGGNDFVGKPFNLAELGLKALIWIFKGQLGQN